MTTKETTMTDITEVIERYRAAREELAQHNLAVANAEAHGDWELRDRLAEEDFSRAAEVVEEADKLVDEAEKMLDAPVWTLLISHRHGESITVFTSPEAAAEAVIQYVDENWADEIPGSVYLEEGESDVRPDDDGEAVNKYFEIMLDEFYSIEQATLNRL